MARPRAYNHDIRCPHCGSNWTPKDGRSRGKQTHRCKDCNYRFTPDGNRSYYPEATIRQALAMYAEGGSISAVARAMDIHYVTVYTWVKKAKWARETLSSERRKRNAPEPDMPASVRKIRGLDGARRRAKVISFDEMWTYVGRDVGRSGGLCGYGQRSWRRRTGRCGRTSRWVAARGRHL